MSAKTVLLVDIESGSVGVALAHLVSGEAPKLFAEARVALPIFTTLNSAVLVREIEKTLRELLSHASLVATRLRGHRVVSQMGTISEVLVFLSPPWTSPGQGQKSLQWEHELTLVSRIQTAVNDMFGAIPTAFHPFGTAASYATDALFQKQKEFLLCRVGGEVTELLLVAGGDLHGQGTVPFGHHTVLRTLQHHAGLSAQEARSALRLGTVSLSNPPHTIAEPLNAAASHAVREFSEAAHDVLGKSAVRGVLIIAPAPLGEWFAHTLANPPSGGEVLVDIFPHSTTVRALHTHHLEPHIAAHAAAPDLLLMLEALFFAKSSPVSGGANKKFSDVQ